MTISEAIARLQKIQAKHGDVAVYFDCPTCQVAFTPDIASVDTVSVVIGGSRQASPGSEAER